MLNQFKTWFLQNFTFAHEKISTVMVDNIADYYNTQKTQISKMAGPGL